MKILSTAAFTLLLSASALARADQFTLFDATFTFTKADADNSKPSPSHYYVKGPMLNAERPKDWTAPVDYRNGTVHCRLEVLSKPQGGEPTMWNVCYIPNKGQKNGYGCIATDVYKETGVYEKDIDMTKFWQHDNIVWSEGIKEMHLVIKDNSGGSGHAHKRADHEKFFPTKVRMTLIQVSKGAKYDPTLVKELSPAGATSKPWASPASLRATLTLNNGRGESSMDPSLVALYHRHVAPAYDRQMRLLKFLEGLADGARWNYTISSADLSFGKTHFEALSLGSHAAPDNSWLWSWCNPHLQLTIANQRLADEVRKLGQRSGIGLFPATRQVSCDQELGEDLASSAAHVLGVIVTGELGFDAYWAIPFQNGTSSAVIRDYRLWTDIPNPVSRILSMFPQLLGDFLVLDHQTAFRAYAQWYGLTVAEDRQTVRVLAGGVEVLLAKFDELRRLTELSGTLTPE